MDNRLVFVFDVYGKRSRVSLNDLEKKWKNLIPLYNQYGNKIDSHKGEKVTCIHRDNILYIKQKNK